MTYELNTSYFHHPADIHAAASVMHAEGLDAATKRTSKFNQIDQAAHPAYYDAAIDALKGAKKDLSLHLFTAKDSGEKMVRFGQDDYKTIEKHIKDNAPKTAPPPNFGVKMDGTPKVAPIITLSFSGESMHHAAGVEAHGEGHKLTVRAASKAKPRHMGVHAYYTSDGKTDEVASSAAATSSASAFADDDVVGAA